MEVRYKKNIIFILELGYNELSGTNKRKNNCMFISSTKMTSHYFK